MAGWRRLMFDLGASIVALAAVLPSEASAQAAAAFDFQAFDGVWKSGEVFWDIQIQNNTVKMLQCEASWTDIDCKFEPKASFRPDNSIGIEMTVRIVGTVTCRFALRDPKHMVRNCEPVSSAGESTWVKVDQPHLTRGKTPIPGRWETTLAFRSNVRLLRTRSA
jgi:hypothetical protein